MGFWDGFKRGVVGLATGGISELAGVYDDNTEKLQNSGYKDPYREANMKMLAEKRQQLANQYNDESNLMYKSADRDQIKNSQLALAQQLQSQASGQGPSIAGMQLQRSTDQNIQQQLALANAMRGGSAGLRNRNALTNAGAMNQEAAGQGAILRLQEQQQAQGALAGLTGQMAQTSQAAKLQDAQQMNALTQNYINMGLSIDQAQFMANKEFEQVRNGVKIQDAGAVKQFIGGIIGTGAQVAGGIATGGASTAIGAAGKMAAR